jgi:hypothetical protein
MDQLQLDIAPAVGGGGSTGRRLRRRASDESPVSRLEIDTTPLAGGDDVWSISEGGGEEASPPIVSCPDTPSGSARSPFAGSDHGEAYPLGGGDSSLEIRLSADNDGGCVPAAAAAAAYGTRALALDFDLTLIPAHTSGRPSAQYFEDLCGGEGGAGATESVVTDYLGELTTHLRDLRQLGVDLYIVTRGDAAAVRAVLDRPSRRRRCCQAGKEARPAGGAVQEGPTLGTCFRGVYGADAASPISRWGPDFSADDMQRIASVAPTRVCGALLRRTDEAGTETDIGSEGGDGDQAATQRALVGRENEPLA